MVYADNLLWIYLALGLVYTALLFFRLELLGIPEWSLPGMKAFTFGVSVMAWPLLLCVDVMMVLSVFFVYAGKLLKA